MNKISAQQILVQKFIDWDKVEERLGSYTNIGSLYSLQDLKRYEDKAPFYCHYLAWRMGTWVSEELFALLDDLIGSGRSLNNWDTKCDEYNDGAFDRFWSYLWELQVADMLVGLPDVQVEWLPSGPDLKVEIEGQTAYIECYVYRKSYGIENFIEEMFQSIFEPYSNVEARVNHRLWLRFSLPHNTDTDMFLDGLFSPYLDDSKVKGLVKQARDNGCVQLHVPNNAVNLKIILEGPKGLPPDGSNQAGAGDGTGYLQNAIKEAIDNKKDSNNLKCHHPNVLAVNFLLGPDFQLGLSRQIRHWGLESVPKPEISGNIDATWFAACGIDKKLSLSDILCFAEDVHPVQVLFTAGKETMENKSG